MPPEHSADAGAGTTAPPAATVSLFGRSRAEVAAALPDREPVDCPLCHRTPTPFAVDFQGLSLARCGGCGLELHSPRPVLEQMATAVYGAAYHRTDEATADARHRRHYRRQLARLERLTASGGGRLLDVGCGAGAFLRFAAERGWTVEGTDFVVSDLARASGARVWDGELPAIAFGGARYDVVRFNHVLEHTRDPLVELRAARDLLSPGGLLLVGVPNLAGIGVRLKSLQSRLRLKRKRWRHYAALHHLWFFTPTTLASLVEAARFEVLHWETPMLGRPGRGAGAGRVYRRLLERWRVGGILDLYGRAV